VSLQKIVSIVLPCFFGHLNILLRADFDAKAAALTIGIIRAVSILLVSIYTVLRADQQAHLAGDAVLLQEMRPGLYSPGAGLAPLAFLRFNY